MSVRISIVTAFPELVRSYLHTGILGRGAKSGKLEVSVVDIRDHATGEYRQIDDYSFGGGGMVLMRGPLEEALRGIASREERYVVYPSPQGVPVYQEMIEDLFRISGSRHLVIVCGRYEGVDERFVRENVDLEVSMGDFVLTGGELPALAIADAVSRLEKGVVGKERAVEEDSFFSGMLDHPHYTRPANYEGDEVPEVLLGGNHEEIADYRRREAVSRTLARRPDIIARANIMPYLSHGVYVIEVHHPVLDRNGKKSATAITGLDLHDIARACRTYGVKKHLVVTPLEAQRDMVKKIASHWLTGYGASFNPDRREAMALIKTFASIERALAWIEDKEKQAPFTIATTAKQNARASHWLGLKREMLRNDAPAAFLFGTGGGLHEELLERADAVLTPILGGKDGYNHLSVRSAAAIILDRFFGFR